MCPSLEGWETRRLLLVRLDAAELSVGLRDIDHFDAFGATDEAVIQSIVNAVNADAYESAPGSLGAGATRRCHKSGMESWVATTQKQKPTDPVNSAR